MANEQVEVQEAEYTEVETDLTQQVRCEVTIGINQAGGVYFNIGGPDQSLILVDGLLKYAARHVDNIWETRLTEKAE